MNLLVPISTLSMFPIVCLTEFTTHKVSVILRASCCITMTEYKQHRPRNAYMWVPKHQLLYDSAVADQSFQIKS
jgi:hypothetical protein